MIVLLLSFSFVIEFNILELKQYILSRKTIVVSNEQIQRFVDILYSENILDKEQRREHVDNVKDKLYVKEYMVKSMICPRCQSALVQRNGKNGTFLGCSNYPNCRFTANL